MTQTSFLDSMGMLASKEGQGTRATFTLEDKVRRVENRLLECGKSRVLLSCKDPFCLDSPERRGASSEWWGSARCQLPICDCPACRASRVSRIRRRYLMPLARMHMPRFLTLTWRQHYRDRLPRHAINELNNSFKLLQQNLRRTKVPGFFGDPAPCDFSLHSYLKVLEVALSDYPDKTGEYHDVFFIHLHIIYEGKYIPHDVLQRSWVSATKGKSRFCRIERAGGIRKISKYLTDYVEKCSSLEGISALDYVRDFRKCQFFSTHGLNWICPECHKRVNASGVARCRCMWRLAHVAVCPYCNRRRHYQLLTEWDQRFLGIFKQAGPNKLHGSANVCEQPGGLRSYGRLSCPEGHTGVPC